MATKSVTVMDRRWANPPTNTRLILTFCDPNEPGIRYETAPYANVLAAEDAAIQAVIDARKRAGLDYPGKAAPTESKAVVT